MTEPKISLIAAMDRNRLIGSRNRMPWRISEDLAWFRAKTLGHTVIMGKNTWLSLGRTLDRRTNLVLTRDRSFRVPGAIVCHSVAECLEHCANDHRLDVKSIGSSIGPGGEDLPPDRFGGNECFVIGGEQVFRLFLPLANTLYLTLIDAEFSGDAYFPVFSPEDWQTVFYETKLSETGYRLTFQEYRRKT